jgi:prolyl 4-hydroxylase
MDQGAPAANRHAMSVSQPDLEARARSGDAAAQVALAGLLDSAGDIGGADLWLRRAADAGDISAKTALAQRAVMSAAYSFEEGIDCAISAANDGGAEAAHLLAMLAGAGLGLPQDWSAALDHLARAAELGHALARRSLAAVSRDRALVASAAAEAAPTDVWRRLRQSADISGWITPTRPRVLSGSPRIAAAEGFLPPFLCDWLIERAQPRLKPAHTVHPRTGAFIEGGGRVNSTAPFTMLDFDLMFLFARHRIARVTGLPVADMEAPAVLHYAVGQEFSPHFDFLDPAHPGHADNLALEGQRVVTFLVYLNDGFEGGETDFPTLRWRHKGRKGDALFFWNVERNFAHDPRTLHAGLPPTRGEKYLLSQWIRGRAPL